MTTATFDPTTIAPEEAETAAEAAVALMSVLERLDDRVEIAAVDQPDERIVVPTAAFELLINVLGEMARGNGVTLMPIETELTTQEAADLLNVSRPFVVKLIDDNVLPARTVGNRRRIRFRDLLTYKEIDDARRRTVADELLEEAQDLGIY